MFKEFAWNAFIKTGKLDFYMFYREIEERDSAADRRNPAEPQNAPSAGNA